MAVVLTNNATSLLAGAIAAGATTLSVENADAGKFPVPAAGDWFPVTVVDNAGNMEIMKATKREGAIITVTRAQEGTTAKAFAAGARIDLRLTAAAIFEIVPTIIGASTIDNEHIEHENARFSWWDVGTKALKFATWAGLIAKLMPKSGGNMIGSLGGMPALAKEDWLASFWADSAGGSYVSVPKRRVPFKAQTTTIGNSYAPVLNATYNTSAWGGVWTQGVINLGNNGQATSYQLIHMHNDGQAQKTFTFDGPSGNFRADGDIRAGSWVYAGSATFQTNGNLTGSIWPNWGASDAFTAIHNRIEARARDFADDRLNIARGEVGWRCKDYLLSEHIPVGGFAFLQIDSKSNLGPGSNVGGGSLWWASADSGNYDGVSPVNYGTWQLVGRIYSGSIQGRTSLWKRIG